MGWQEFKRRFQRTFRRMRRSERTQMLVYTVLLVVTSPLVFEMLVLGWERRPWGLSRHFMLGFINVTGVPAEFPYVAGVSIYIGITFTMLFDEYKRYQGVFLWLGLLIGGWLTLSTQTELLGTLRESVNPAGLLVIAGFVLIGMFLAGVTRDDIRELSDRLAGESDERIKVERNLGPITLRPPVIVLVVTAAVFAVGAFEAVLDYQPALVVTGTGVTRRSGGFVLEAVVFPQTVITGLVGSGFFLYGLSRFTTYEKDMNIIQIGPARSGKSASFVGLAMMLQDRRNADYRDNEGVDEINDPIENGRFPPATGNDEIRLVKADYETGRWFPEQRSLQTVDYGGMLLGDILGPVRGDANFTGRANSWAEATNWIERVSEVSQSTDDIKDGLAEVGVSVGDDSDGDGSDQYETVSDVFAEAVWDCIRHADQIVLTVPVDDFLGPVLARGNEPEYLNVVRADDYDDEAALKNELDLSADETIPDHYVLTHEGERFYIRRDIRDLPADYLDWYKSLESEFRETEFLVAATKADYVERDFRGDGASLPRVKHDAFRDHVADVLSEASGLVKNRYGRDDGSDTHRIWPVWYDVAEVESPDADDEGLRIEDNDPLLGGSEELVDRLER
jgi:hypothetical protein